MDVFAFFDSCLVDNPWDNCREVQTQTYRTLCVPELTSGSPTGVSPEIPTNFSELPLRERGAISGGFLEAFPGVFKFQMNSRGNPWRNY